MEDWKNYRDLRDLGYDIPRYAVMEALRAMRDNAEPQEKDPPFSYFATCPNSFHIKDTFALGLCLLANARCVGMNVSAINVEANKNGILSIQFI